MTEKKSPLRKCLGCNEMKDKRALLRVVRSKDGAIAVDPTGKMPGRGAYICASAACFDAARKARRFERAFSAKIEDETYERLRSRIEERS